MRSVDCTICTHGIGTLCRSLISPINPVYFLQLTPFTIYHYSFNQVPVTLWWTDSAWNEKMSLHFCTWTVSGNCTSDLLTLWMSPYPHGHVLHTTIQHFAFEEHLRGWGGGMYSARVHYMSLFYGGTLSNTCRAMSSRKVQVAFSCFLNVEIECKTIR